MNFLQKGNDGLLELLAQLKGDLNEEVFGAALEIVRRALGASRAYLLRLDEPRKMLRLLGEARRGESVIPLPAGFEYPAEKEAGWNTVSDANWIYALDVRNAETIAKYGLNVEINDRLGIRSLYVIRFAAEGRNWGSLGVDYEGEPHEVDEDEWKFFVTASSLLQLAIVRNERLRALELERDRARAAETAKSYFFSTVSHDIRTPLNAIVGYAELLKLGIDDEAERRKAVDSLLVSSRTLLELINDVLDLSKLEAGRMEILPEPVDVMKLVREVAGSFRASLGEKPVEIRAEVHPMPWLRLDPQRIRQILFNLVGNAVKFTAEGYVEIEAEFERTGERRGTFRMTVTDTGCGISEEDQHRIADPYVQVGTNASRNRGTGLGLAICQHLITRMNGEIELESVLGRGTKFFVTIPDVEEEDGKRQSHLSTTQRIRFAVSRPSKTYNRVLIVDDQAMNRMVLKTMLARFGIRDVETTCDGREALERLRTTEKPFDLVLSDMWMPELDGEGLVREIRRNPAWADLPVYAVTADVEAQKTYARMGFSGILLKPLTLEKLKELVG